MSIHSTCPHCRVVRELIRPNPGSPAIVRCPSCLCRWDVFGTLVKWGLRCPYLVRA